MLCYLGIYFYLFDFELFSIVVGNRLEIEEGIHGRNRENCISITIIQV